MSAVLRRILVTGGAGFVGGWICLHLRRQFPEAEVLAFDSLYRKGSALNVPRLEAAGVRFVRGDVRDASFGLDPCDLVIDAAAEPSVLAGADGQGVRYLLDTNLVGTINALEHARTWNAAFLLLSTGRVYPIESLRAIRLETHGERFDIATAQDIPGVSPAGIATTFPMEGGRTLYGASKLASETLVREYAATFGLRALINRCGVIAGPWQMGRVDQGVLALWVAAHHYGLPLRILGYGGRQVRDFLHVEDLLELLARQCADTERWQGQVVPVGGGVAGSASLRELTSLAAAATGRRLEMAEDPAVRAGDVPLYITDHAAALAEWGWRPRRDVPSIVADVARWVRDHEASLRDVFGAQGARGP